MSQYPPGPGQVPNYASPPPQSPVSGLAVAAMVVGIVAIFPGCCLSYYGLIGLGIVAIVFGVLARNQISTGRAGVPAWRLPELSSEASGRCWALVLS